MPDYVVIAPKPLFQADFKEIEFLKNLKQRLNALPNVSNDERTFSFFNFINSKFSRTVLNLSEKFPRGSRQRAIARKLVYRFPLSFRNRIVSSLASSQNYIDGNKYKTNYAFDLGFGIPTSNQPLVSIIIPVHNNWWITYNCLRSLQTNINRTPFEVIVVDDSSNDQTFEALTKIRGVTVVRNEKNLGYLLSTNRGASLANINSKYLVLLNNDTEQIGDWLDSLLRRIEVSEKIAIVGSTLIYPDGILQESGGQIFRTGNAWNLGKGKNPLAGQFRFLREVDYCSAASIMVRKSFWDSVNGFDPQFTPAYCEDSDLCMTAWSRGYKVVVDPKSWIIHHEGMSHGKNTDAGLKSYQLLNNEKLRNKWSTQLKYHWQDLGVARLEARRDSLGIIVFLDMQFPVVNRDAGSIRTLQLINHFQELNYHVVLCTIDNSSSESDVTLLEDLGVEIHKSKEELLENLSGRSSRVKHIYYCRDDVYKYFSNSFSEVFPHAKQIVDLMDLKYKVPYQQSSGIVEHYKEIAKKVDQIILVSEKEAEELNLACGVEAKVIWAEYEPKLESVNWEHTNGLLFVGGFRHHPNLEGLTWFAEEVLPKLKKMGFTHPIRVIGSGLSESQRESFMNLGLSMLGAQENLGDFYKRSRISIVPLLSGAGRKGKVAEALAFGIPVISTPVGAEGFGNLPDAGITIAYNSEDMAKKIVSLHADQSTWNNMSKNAKEYCRKFLSHSELQKRLSETLEYKRV